ASPLIRATAGPVLVSAASSRRRANSSARARPSPGSARSGRPACRPGYQPRVSVPAGAGPGCSGSPIGSSVGGGRYDPAQVGGRLDDPGRAPPGQERAAEAVAVGGGPQAGGPLVRQLTHDVGVGGGEHGLLLGGGFAVRFLS